MKLFFSYIKESLSLDYRSLALYRFFLGIIVMVDVLYRLPDLSSFYTDTGILPRFIFLSELSLPWSFSLHLANGSLGFIFLLFMINFLVGLGLSLGYKTRMMTCFCWLLTISVHNRNWLVNNGGHDILRAILFISIFLPLGKYFSLDALREKRFFSEQNKTTISSWSITFFAQVFLIYFISYILKDHPIWRKDFTAVFYVSRLDIFATPMGVFSRGFPFLQKLMTIYTIFLEYFGPIILVTSGFFLSKWWVMRLLVILAFFLLHLGIILTMYIGVFPYLCLVFWLAFLPSVVWQWFRLPKFLSKLGVFFQQEESAIKNNSLFENKYLSFLFQMTGIFYLTALLSWNLISTKKVNYSWPIMSGVIQWLHVYQDWNMFSPFPKQDNIWIEVPATFNDGSQVELISGSNTIGAMNSANFPEFIQNEQWRKFYLNLSEDSKYLKYFGSYLCRKWNFSNEDKDPHQKLRNMEIIIYSQLNLLDGTQGPIQRKHSWLHWCYDKDMAKDLGKK